MTTKKTTAQEQPAEHANPPHGGSWQRNADGSLELLQVTKPAEGRAQREPQPKTTTEE